MRALSLLLKELWPDLFPKFWFWASGGEGKFLKNTNCSLSHRSYLKLSFDALLKALAPFLKELWPIEGGQNFGFLPVFKN